MRKSDQTYEWALAAMQTPHPGGWGDYAHTQWDKTPVEYLRLNDIHKKHHTDELLLAAVKNGHAHLQEVPDRIVKQLSQDEVLRSLQCSHFKQLASSIYPLLPDEINTFALRKDLVSAMPEMFNVVFYSQRKGRENAPYSDEDLQLVLEALCPTVYGERRINNLINKPTFDSPEEKTDFIITEIARSFSKLNLPSRLVYTALKEMYDRQNAPTQEHIASSNLKDVVILKCTHESRFGVDVFVSIHPDSESALAHVDDVKYESGYEEGGSSEYFDYDLAYETIDVSLLPDHKPEQTKAEQSLDDRIAAAKSQQASQGQDMKDPVLSLYAGGAAR